eukprot:g5926.t1
MVTSNLFGVGTPSIRLHGRAFDSMGGAPGGDGPLLGLGQDLDGSWVAFLAHAENWAHLAGCPVFQSMGISTSEQLASFMASPVLREDREILDALADGTAKGRGRWFMGLAARENGRARTAYARQSLERARLGVQTFARKKLERTSMASVLVTAQPGAERTARENCRAKTYRRATFGQTFRRHNKGAENYAQGTARASFASSDPGGCVVIYWNSTALLGSRAPSTSVPCAKFGRRRCSFLYGFRGCVRVDSREALALGCALLAREIVRAKGSAFAAIRTDLMEKPGGMEVRDKVTPAGTPGALCCGILHGLPGDATATAALRRSAQGGQII